MRAKLTNSPTLRERYRDLESPASPNTPLSGKSKSLMVEKRSTTSTIVDGMSAASPGLKRRKLDEAGSRLSIP